MSCRSQVPWIRGYYAEYTNITTDLGPVGGGKARPPSCSPSEMLLEQCSSGRAETTVSQHAAVAALGRSCCVWDGRMPALQLEKHQECGLRRW